ncbi:MAG: DUF4331 family protein [Anaerolineae bacterium]|nr:DUF4331 family protein [Anaerolineae bacterium]
MIKKVLIIGGTVAVFALALILSVNANPTGAADHLDAPAVQNDGRTDINDLYVFRSPTNPDRTVLIMSVNPLAGVQSPTNFRPWASYQFKIDTDGDAKPEEKIAVGFGKVRKNGEQRIRVRFNGRTVARGWTGDTVRLRGGGKLIADVFDDPFFFDLAAFRNGLAFCPPDGDPNTGTGADFFAGLNVSAIVLEIPSKKLGGDNIGVWAAPRVKGKQVDRMGRPAINTVFISSDSKDDFNKGQPRNDQRDFRGEVVATLLALGNDQATADALADFLLPDILTVNTADPSGFPNGRGVADDVIDTELGLITGGAVPSDCVDANDVPFPGEFPYLAEAQ